MKVMTQKRTVWAPKVQVCSNISATYDKYFCLAFISYFEDWNQFQAFIILIEYQYNVTCSSLVPDVSFFIVLEQTFKRLKNTNSL